jgi:hypothetical protein
MLSPLDLADFFLVLIIDIECDLPGSRAHQRKLGCREEMQSATENTL